MTIYGGAGSILVMLAQPCVIKSKRAMESTLRIYIEIAMASTLNGSRMVCLDK